MKKKPAKKTITYETRKDMFMDNPIKEASKKTKIDRICDLVDCWVDKEITQDELIERLMTIIDKRIIKVSDIEFYVSEWKGDLYLNSRQELADGSKDNWVQVEDLTELRVWEYNQLVGRLNQEYPDYPIEHLEGRFV